MFVAPPASPPPKPLQARCQPPKQFGPNIGGLSSLQAVARTALEDGEDGVDSHFSVQEIVQLVSMFWC